VIKAIAQLEGEKNMIQNLNQNAQSTLPETFDTNSSITRVFPVPQAISIVRATLAHASGQSR